MPHVLAQGARHRAPQSHTELGCGIPLRAGATVVREEASSLRPRHGPPAGTPPPPPQKPLWQPGT